jgi:hypothetical protein
MLLGSVSILLFAGAAILHSNLLGSLTILSSLWTLVWFFGGQRVADLLRGPVFLLLLIVPLPWNALVEMLQKKCESQRRNLARRFNVDKT